MEKQNKQDVMSLVPHGLVVTRTWLLEQGITRHTVDNWLKSGRLVAVAQGVFMRPDTKLTWRLLVCSMQRMNKWLWLVPGGQTALAEWRMTHYLSSSELKVIHLYGSQKLPLWMNKVLPDTKFVRHAEVVDMAALSGDSTKKPGTHLRLWRPQYLSFPFENLRVDFSSPELAVLEALADVPDVLSFEHANYLIQGAATLSPSLLETLLEHCTSVKVKRLLFYLAGINNSAWLKKLNLEKFSMASGSLGHGKRVIVKGGKLDPTFLITVPYESGVASE